MNWSTTESTLGYLWVQIERLDIEYWKWVCYYLFSITNTCSKNENKIILIKHFLVIVIHLGSDTSYHLM